MKRDKISEEKMNMLFGTQKKRRKSGNGRKNGKNGMPSLLVLLLALVLGFSLFFAYKEAKKDPAKPIDYHERSYMGETPITGRKLYYDTAPDPEDKDEIWVMYQNLSSRDKNVYDFFLDLVENRNVKNYHSIIVISNETRKALDTSHFWEIYYVMLFDHPEYFFLESDVSRLDCYYTDMADYTTYHFLVKPYDGDEDSQIEAFNKATEEFMSQIDLTASDAEIELQIHDRLIELVSYNNELFDSRFTNESKHDLGYTAYGALVCDSSGRENYAVCAGYSRAFQHLLNMAGIPCGYISGYAYVDTEEKPDDSNHAWNCVKVGGKWYEVDTTWDDFDHLGDDEGTNAFFDSFENNQDAYFNTLHHYYNRSTMEMKDLPVTDETVFSIPGYREYNSRRRSYHIRALEVGEKVDKGEVFRNSLVPIAE